MRISDWSSDVCSSDLTFDGHLAYTQALALAPAGGIAAELKQDADLVVLLQKVLNCCAPPRCQEDGAQADCTLPDLPTALVEKKHDRPDLIGPLGIGSTASQTFLLEYLESMQMERSEEHPSELQSLMLISYD